MSCIAGYVRLLVTPLEELANLNTVAIWLRCLPYKVVWKFKPRGVITVSEP